MTISEKIIEWLTLNPKIEMVDTDFLQSDEAMGLFKMPSDIIERYISGAKYTRYYTFNIRQSSQLNTERISNQQFMEELEQWIEAQSVLKNYPIADCIHIRSSGGYAVQEMDGEQTVYQIILEIKYIGRA